MKLLRFAIMSIVLLILSLNFLVGCSSPRSEGVQFNNEPQLDKEGFVVKLNQEVYFGDEKVLFQKVVFDRNSIMFVYKGGTIQLPGSSVMVKGDTNSVSDKGLEYIAQQPQTFGVTVSSDYHVTAVPHNLKLIQQQVAIEINMDGRVNTFSLNFPGDKIASSTAELTVDSNGRPVEEGANPAVKVIVGIGSTVVESKGDSDFVVVDKVGKKLSSRSHKVSTTGEAEAVFEPIALPRKDIKIKVIPEDGTVIITHI